MKEECMNTVELDKMISNYESETAPLKKVKLGYNIASYYYFKLNKLEETMQYLLQVLKIAEDINDEKLITLIYNLMGASYRNMGMNKEAKEVLLRAVEIGESLQDHFLLCRTYLDLGGVYINIYSHSLAIDCYEKSLKYAELINDNEVVGFATIMIGRTYQEIQDYQKAVMYLRKALKILKRDHEQIYICYYNIALAYTELKEYALAIGYFKRVILLIEKINRPEDVAGVYCSIGGIYIKLQKYDKAMEYALKIQNYITEKQIDSEDVESNLCVLYITLYHKQGEVAKTEKYIHKFLELVVTNKARLGNFYDIAVSFYKEQQRFDFAFYYLQRYNEINKIILDEEMQTNMAIKMANFEYEREKQSAELLRQKNDELIKLHTEKDNLMNTISHDLKNYLGATQQALDIFAIKEKEMFENKYIKIVATSTARSLNLVKEILYSSKVDASADTLSLKTVDINKVINAEEDTLHLRASKKGINVVFEYEPEPLFVQLDNEKWHRVFENLTTNAIKFTSAGKDIRISTKRESNFAVISIKDSGIGIAPENIGKLFTPFSGVGRKGTEGEESTGLGLSIVKKLVELHGGTIEVFSEVGKGTEFVVRLSSKL